MTKMASKYENSCAMYADCRWYVDELTTSRIDSGLKTGVLTQGSYRSWKSWKVMEFKYFSFQAWKVMEFNCWLWKGMENYSVCGTEIIAGVD